MVKVANGARRVYHARMDKKTWTKILETLRKCPIRKDAIEQAGVTPEDVRAYFLERPDARREFMAAFDEGMDALEDEAIRRALHGVEEPVFGREGLLGYKTVYANDLTKVILSAYRARYRGELNQGGSLSEEARNTLTKVFSAWVGVPAEGASPTEEEQSAKPAKAKPRQPARSKYK